MKITSIKVCRSDTPIPVYDATSPVYHNLTLANGCVVHNTAKKARDSSFQEVMRLTGKISNALRTPIAKLIAGKTVQNLLVSFGYDHSKPDPENHLRVGKIFFLADADPDGKHINALLAVLIYKLMPKLYEQGRVLVCDAPLFSAFYKGVQYFGNTFQECYKLMPKGAPKDIITRAKGWGELNPETLATIAFHPDTRNTILLKPVAGKEEAYFKAIMSSDSAARKELLGL